MVVRHITIRNMKFGWCSLLYLTTPHTHYTALQRITTHYNASPASYPYIKTSGFSLLAECFKLYIFISREKLVPCISGRVRLWYFRGWIIESASNPDPHSFGFWRASSDAERMNSV